MATIQMAQLKVKGLSKFIAQDLAREIGKISLAEIKESFDKQAYVSDNTPAKDRWKSRGGRSSWEKVMNYPKLNRTGNLKKSFLYIVRKTPFGAELVVGSTQKYAQFQQEGHGWHSNRYVSGSHFNDGKARYIRSPRTKGRKFLGMGKRTEKSIKKMLDLKFNSIMKR